MSTITALTTVASVLVTLLVVGLVLAVLRWRQRQRQQLGSMGEADENTSLLGAAGRRRSYWVYNTVPGDGEERPRLERCDTGEEEAEAVGGREFEERRRRMLERGVGDV